MLDVGDVHCEARADVERMNYGIGLWWNGVFELEGRKSCRLKHDVEVAQLAGATREAWNDDMSPCRLGRNPRERLPPSGGRAPPLQPARFWTARGEQHAAESPEVED